MHTTEHIKAFIADVAKVASDLDVDISVNLESAIYGNVWFQVTPNGEPDIGRSPLSGGDHFDPDKA